MVLCLATWEIKSVISQSVSVSPLSFFFEHGFLGLTRMLRFGYRVSPLDKIRSILIIRVRFTSEFFFEHGFLGLTRMLRSWRYCLPDSSHYKSWKSRDFVPGYSRFARYWLPAKSTIYATKQPKTDTYLFIFLFIDIFSSVQFL